jgi:hypothetical protein
MYTILHMYIYINKHACVVNNPNMTFAWYFFWLYLFI